MQGTSCWTFHCRRRRIDLFILYIDYEKVILCEDKLITEQQTADTMIHETIHAFDHCRVNIDWTDCAQHACSEVYYILYWLIFLDQSRQLKW